MSLQNTYYNGLSNEEKKKFSKVYENRNHNQLYEELQKSHGPLQKNEEYHSEDGPELNNKGRLIPFTKKQNGLNVKNQVLFYNNKHNHNYHNHHHHNNHYHHHHHHNNHHHNHNHKKKMN